METPHAPQTTRGTTGIRPGDRALSAIVTADFFGAMAGAMVHLTMIWWVLSQDVSDRIVGLMVLSIFLPLNLGVLASGLAVTRFGSRTLLVWSKSVAILGAFSCFALLATDQMTLWRLAIVAFVTYGAMGPSIAADISRVPALTRLAGRKLASFHAVNSVVMVAGQVGGMVLAGFLADELRPDTIVALGIGLIIASAVITWAYFPRDRLKPSGEATAIGQFSQMSRDVLACIRTKEIGLAVIIVAAGIVATNEGVVEVILPISSRAADLSPTALSYAYILAIVSGVFGAYLSQARQGEVPLLPTLLKLTFGLLAALLIAGFLQNMLGVFLAVAVTSFAAWFAGNITVSTIQENMPVSLQAQAMSLFQTLMLAVGALTILITGQIGSLSMLFMILIALVSVAAGYIALKQK